MTLSQIADNNLTIVDAQNKTVRSFNHEKNRWEQISWSEMMGDYEENISLDDVEIYLEQKEIEFIMEEVVGK